MQSTVLILHNIRSEHNVGAILRTADACGVEKVFLTGYTPTPIDRFRRVSKRIHKTALGAEESVAWESGNIAHIIQKLSQQDYVIVALEQDPRAVTLTAWRRPDRVAIIVGNEVRGVSKQLRDKAHVILEIPMKGKKESLNVSVATGVALFMLTC